MTLRDLHKLRSEKLWAEFSFPTAGNPAGDFFKGVNGRRGAPHHSERSNVFRHWCCDTFILGGSFQITFQNKPDQKETAMQNISSN